MQYTLRIIDQSKNQLELAKNYSLGDEYFVRMKVPNRTPLKENEESLDFFHEHLQIFLGGDPLLTNVKELYEEDWKNIIGLVYSKDFKTYSILNTDVAYIVNENGKTFERLYGQYQKY